MKPVVVLLAVFVGIATASKILIIVPVPATSHIILFDPLVLELGRRGHQVTYVSARKLSETHPNVNQIVVPTEMKTPGLFKNLFLFSLFL